MNKLLVLLSIAPAVTLAQSATVPRLSANHSVQSAAHPIAGLVSGEHGVFYGVTANGDVMVYEITRPDALAVLHSFNETDGFSLGELIEFALAPDVPTNVIASASSSSGTADGEIRVSWDPVRDATTYDVYRGTSSGNLTVMSGGGGVTGTNLLVTGLTPGVVYYFAVVATNQTGSSARSAEVTAIPRGLIPVVGGVAQPSDSGGGGSLDVFLLALLLMIAASRITSVGLRYTRN